MSQGRGVFHDVVASTRDARTRATLEWQMKRGSTWRGDGNTDRNSDVAEAARHREELK